LKQIYILGAGGLGKEFFHLLKDINKDKKSLEFMSFIDNNPEILDIKIGKERFPVMSESYFIEHFGMSEDINLVIAVGQPKHIKRIATFYLENTKINFPNLIHPSVITDFDSLDLGIGNVITAGCILPVDVSLNSFNIVNINSTIGHDTIIGSYNVINPGANISGNVSIGDENLIGTNCTILQTLKIGSQNTLSAASFIAKDVLNSQTLMGNPARIISQA
jgi:sugar O-acyltransferase (sialic acid O-acetyltransferase NeuD family)